MSKKIAYISFNLDSVGYATNTYPLKNDPAFTIALPRIEKILDKYNAKMSIFVIGQDLHEDSNIEVLKSLIKRGHEVGNHTYSHFQNFSFLSNEQQSYEIEKTHQLIKEKLDYDSKGFIAPGWNSNNFTIKKLVELNYFYDHSLAPTPLMLLGLIKMLINKLMNTIFNKKVEDTYKISELFSRKDYLRMFTGREKPYQVKDSYKASNEKKLWVVPLPTKYKISYWLTLEYVFPKFLVDIIFNFVAKYSNQFYLLVHPADFLDNLDLKHLKKKPNLERLDVDIDQKLEVFEKRINDLIDNGYEIRTFISNFEENIN